MSDDQQVESYLREVQAKHNDRFDVMEQKLKAMREEIQALKTANDGLEEDNKIQEEKNSELGTEFDKT